ncbi:hypothetical protein SELMODRAFT_405102 [Selaginella moellendorffii]|uniref:Uncharacterized protein n=1 Tax=Selaginella moellendorffii TaxID=88036 RepID=D8QYE3_SELML|nr:uncharacterized protein LOC9643527 [Selaginella moellendorffii]EFJ35594.1 hypothetical protein SELMODRAFT_405102 [Selaginella moellendorffii]|eukprot:XP_002963723.1 uncharacterized protein LOC9643527 [Selaginella moellendorffii]
MAADAVRAEQIKQTIIALGDENFRKLVDPRPGEIVASLPFPGLPWSRTGTRPPKVFDFVTRQEYGKILSRLVEKIGENPSLDVSCVVSLSGVKGSGKSCFLRALAILLISAQIPKVRIICIWYLDATAPLVPQITAALYFAFSDDAEAVEKIGFIDSPDSLDAFLKIRVQNEKFFLLVDGAERYDKSHKNGSPRRLEDTEDAQAARRWLDVFYKWSTHRFQTFSHNVTRVDVTHINEHFNCLFTTEEYNTFLTTCKILGPMLRENPDRVAVVDHLAGRHPMSLYLLEEKCAQYVNTITGNAFNKRKVENPLAMAVLKRKTETGPVPARFTTEIVSSAYCSPPGHKFLADACDWSEVVWLFREDENFQSMRKQPELVDGFLLPIAGQESSIPCTPFIRELDLQMRLLRRERHAYRTPQMRALLQQLLKERNTVWPQVGYICEGIVAEAVLDEGFCFRGTNYQADRVESLSGKPKLITASDLNTNEKVFYMTGSFNFKYVDGLLVWKDGHGMLHFWFVQVCLNPGAHRGTEFKFVRREEFIQWTILTDPFKLYYVYVCPRPTSLPSEEHEENRTLEQGTPEKTNKPTSRKKGTPEKTKGTKNKEAKELVTHYEQDDGTVAYTKAEISFDRCLRLTEEEIALLKELGKLRERLANEKKAKKKQRENEEDEQLADKQKYRGMFLRAELQDIAEKYGIPDASSRKKFPSTPDLILAIPLNGLMEAEVAKMKAKQKAGRKRLKHYLN